MKKYLPLLLLLTGCNPAENVITRADGYPHVKEFSHKGHDYLLTTKGPIMHAASCPCTTNQTEAYGHVRRNPL